jgi:hypothetical protein
MDNNLEILLNSEKNINSVNVDNFTKIELLSKIAPINEYDIKNVLSATELFELERQECETYRIYGKIEYLSLLNGLKEWYEYFSDFFRPQETSNKNIFNSFDFYLVRPAETGYTQNTVNNDLYSRFFKVLATPNDFELFKTGFAKNVFGEQTYGFNFTVDIDISELRDEFGMPLTELFLYAQYKNTPTEILTYREWLNTEDGSNYNNVPFSTKSFNVGDFITTISDKKIGDYVQYTKNKYLLEQTKPQNFRIKTPIIEEEIDDESNKITFTSTTCELFYENNSPSGNEFYKEYKQNLIFSIQQPQTFDVNITYKKISEFIVNAGEPTIQITTGSTIIPASETFVIVNGLQCRVESLEDFSAGGTEYTVTNITYELITTTISESNDFLSKQTYITWKYNPFIPIRLRYFDDSLSRANTGNTSYDVTSTIPDYATNIENGNVIWRGIVPEGYTNPITLTGVDHPFVNKKHYVFSSIILDVVPDLEDITTFNYFQKIWFENNTTLINAKPINNINEFNKPCL